MNEDWVMGELAAADGYSNNIEDRRPGPFNFSTEEPVIVPGYDTQPKRMAGDSRPLYTPNRDAQRDSTFGYDPYGFKGAIDYHGHRPAGPQPRYMAPVIQPPLEDQFRQQMARQTEADRLERYVQLALQRHLEQQQGRMAGDGRGMDKMMLPMGN